MADDPQSPAQTDAADAGASSEPQAAAPAVTSGERRELASFDDALRSQEGLPGAGESGNGGTPTGADDDPDDGESAPSTGDEKPTQQPGNQGRRSKAAEANLQRIADLERQVAERDPEAIRQQVRADFEAEQQRKAEAEATQAAADADAEEAAWYQRVRDVLDRNLSNEDYQRREDYKAKLDAYPEVVRKATALAKREADAEKAQHAAEVQVFWKGIHGRFGLLQTLPGVVKERLAETDLYEIGRHLYDTGGDIREAQVEARVRAELQPKLDAALEEVRRLKDASQQFRVNGRGGLAAARAPIAGGGRSGASSSATPDWKSSKGGDFFEAAIKRDADERH